MTDDTDASGAVTSGKSTPALLEDDEEEEEDDDDEDNEEEADEALVDVDVPISLRAASAGLFDVDGMRESTAALMAEV